MRNQEVQVLNLYRNTKKFKDFTEDDKKKLAATLQTLSLFVGSANPIEDIMLVMLVNHLIRFEPDLSTEELNEAVQMAVAGQLSANTNPYNVGISAQYLKTIITAYKSFKNQCLIKYRDLQDEESYRESQEKNKLNYDPYEAAISTFSVTCERQVQALLKSGGPENERIENIRGETVKIGAGITEWQDAAAMIILNKIGFWEPDVIGPVLIQSGTESVEKIPSDIRAEFFRSKVRYIIEHRNNGNKVAAGTKSNAQEVYDQTMAYFTQMINNLKQK